MVTDGAHPRDAMDDTEGHSMGETRLLNLAMQDAQLFEKFISRRVLLESEFTFFTPSADHTGFVTALDNTHIQITTTNGLNAVLLTRSNVDAIEATGKTLVGLDSESQKKIREYGAVFHRIVQRETARK